jgi:hypothetical protein
MPRPPNVLLIIADDHRHSALGVAGEAVRTPALDALAGRKSVDDVRQSERILARRIRRDIDDPNPDAARACGVL